MYLKEQRGLCYYIVLSSSQSLTDKPRMIPSYGVFKFMLLSNRNPLGGRPSINNKFPLGQDKQGNFGIRIGYLQDGEPILISLSDVESMANNFATTLYKHNKYLRSLKPRDSFKVWLCKKILGEKQYYRLINKEESGREVD